MEGLGRVEWEYGRAVVRLDNSGEIRSQRSLYTRRTHGVKRLQEVRKQRMPRATRSRCFETHRNGTRPGIFGGIATQGHCTEEDWRITQYPQATLAGQCAGDEEVGTLPRAKLAVARTAQRQDNYDRELNMTGSTAHGLFFG